MRGIVATLVGVLLFGGFASIASSFGSDPVKTVAPGNAVAAGCDPDGVTTSYSTGFDAVDKRFEVTAVTVGGVADDCDGQAIEVALVDSGGVRIAAGRLVIPAGATTSFDVPLGATPSAEAAAAVHVVIAG
jgi:hypothetical protein